MRLLFGFILMIVTSTLNSQTIVRMQQIRGVSTIPCKINGLPLNFIFDTGASEVSLSLTEVSFMLKNGYLKKEDFIGTSNYLDANGEIREGLKVIIKKIEIGNLFISDVTANIVKNLKAPILLGQTALRKFGKFQVDFEENTITFFANAINNVSNEKIQIDSTEESYQSNEERIYLSAEENFDKKFYNEAIAELDALILRNNKVGKYYLLRALSYDNLKEFNTALSDYNNYLKLNPKDAKILAYRGQTYYELKDTTKALIDLTNSIKYDSTNSYPYEIRAIIKYDKKLYSAAILDLNKAIKYDINNCNHYRRRGFAKQKIEKYKESIIDFNKAISLCEDDVSSYLGRSESKIRLKDFTSALDDLNEAEKIDSTISQVYSQKAKIASLENEKELAITYYEKALSLDSTDFMSEIWLHILKEEVKNDIWSYLFSSNGDEYFMKKSPESNENGIIQIWLQVKHKKITVGKKGNQMTYLNPYSNYLAEFNCASKRLRFIYIVTYDSKKNVIAKEEDEYADFEIIAPGTNGELWLQKVCQKYNQ